MLFLLPEAAGWSEAPYTAVEPEDVAAMVRRAAVDPAFLAAALAELDRKLAAQADCRRARWLRAELERAATGTESAGSSSIAAPR
jgi:hypothetical protein